MAKPSQYGGRLCPCKQQIQIQLVWFTSVILGVVYHSKTTLAPCSCSLVYCSACSCLSWFLSIPLLRLLLSCAIKKRLYCFSILWFDGVYKRSNHILNGFPNKQENTAFIRLGFDRSTKQFAYSNEVNITSFNMEIS